MWKVGRVGTANGQWDYRVYSSCERGRKGKEEGRGGSGPLERQKLLLVFRGTYG